MNIILQQIPQITPHTTIIVILTLTLLCIYSIVAFVFQAVIEESMMAMLDKNTPQYSCFSYQDCSRIRTTALCAYFEIRWQYRFIEERQEVVRGRFRHFFERHPLH